MDVDSGPPAPASPQPGLIKTIGILNIFIGGILLIGGLACLIFTAPAVVGNMPLRIEPGPTQAFFDVLRSQRIADIVARRQEAGTVAERERIEVELKRVGSIHPDVMKEIDFPKVNADLAWLSRYLGLDLLSGVVLNVLLVVAGVGLVLGKDRGRVLSMWADALKLARLVALGALLIGVVIPRAGAALEALMSTEMGRDFLAHAIEQERARRGQGGGVAGPQLSPRDVAPMIRSLGIFSAIGLACLGSAYPLVALILLGRPGARAACVAAEMTGAEKRAL